MPASVPIAMMRKRRFEDQLGVVFNSMCSSDGEGYSIDVPRAERAERRPDLLYAYVGSGQVVDEARGESIRYDTLLRTVKRVGVIYFIIIELWH